METLTLAGIDQEKVRERVSEYIANRGYVKERTFGPERLGLDGFNPSGPKDLILPESFWANMAILMALQDLFKPVREVYQEGKSLYAKASVLTPMYDKFVNIREELKKEIAEAPWWKKIGFWFTTFGVNLDDHIAYCTSPKVPHEESVGALQGLCSLLQEDGRDIINLSLPSDASEKEKGPYRVKQDLHKIKNHTAIVCLDQLQKDGLNLDERISVELKRIPQGYLQDAYFWNKNVSSPFRLKDGHCLFGEGLF